MNAIRCPNCGTNNLLSAAQCQRCAHSFANLPSTAYVSVPPEQVFQAHSGFSVPPVSVPQDNEIGRKTFFWYRVYCVFLAALYVLVAAMGIAFMIYQPATREYSSEETYIIGILYTILGLIFFLIFAVALFLPRKPYNWIVGIVMMALGMTSCCFVPFLIPLIIYWVKPETKAYFGRN